MRYKSLSLVFSFLVVFCLSFSAGCSSGESAKQSVNTPAKTNRVSPADLVRQAKEWLSQGDLPKAVTALKVALNADPKNADAHFLLARTMMHFKNFEMAIEHFNATLSLQPTNGEAYFLMGGCYDYLGDKEKAVQSLARSISIFKENNDQENLKRALIVLQSLSKNNVSDKDISSISDSK